MKANKALKRLTKIEELLSDVKARYSVAAPDLRQAIQNAGSAIAQAKEIVSLQAAAKADRGAKKAAPARTKTAVKTEAANATKAESAKKRAPIKKAATMAASAAAHAAPEPVPVTSQGERPGNGFVETTIG
jgi:hypothetical protein